jgi:hypothetical protein
MLQFTDDAEILTGVPGLMIRINIGVRIETTPSEPKILSVFILFL